MAPGQLVLLPSFGCELTVDQNNIPLVSSRRIANDFEKRHADVLRDIEQHLTNADLRSLNRRPSGIDLAPGGGKTHWAEARRRLASLFKPPGTP